MPDDIAVRQLMDGRVAHFKSLAKSPQALECSRRPRVKVSMIVAATIRMRVRAPAAGGGVATQQGVKDRGDGHDSGVQCRGDPVEQGLAGCRVAAEELVPESDDQLAAAVDRPHERGPDAQRRP